MNILKIDTKDIPPYENLAYMNRCCKPCKTDCISENCTGSIEFTGPKRVNLKPLVINKNPFDTDYPRNLRMPRTYQIFKKLSDDLYDLQASVGDEFSATICCDGDYVLRYCWDSCHETEPEFVFSDVSINNVQTVNCCG